MKRTNKIQLFLAAASLLVLSGSLIIFFTHKTDKADAIQNSGQNHPAGPFNVQVALEPEKPRIGNNQITLVVRDQDNRPVTDAAIQAVAEMPAMGAMAAMPIPIEIKSVKPGVYQGQFELPMAGAWPLTLTIDSTTKGQARLTFDMGTSRKGMSLTSATPGDSAPQPNATTASPASTFTVDAYRRQLIGVTTGKVMHRKLIKTIHSPAQITYDETRLTDVSLKFDGWIGRLDADYVGKPVKKGQALFTVYSPELVSTQDEYLDSLRRSRTGPGSLTAAAYRRLTLWGIDATQIRALERRGQAAEYVPILSPVTGTIIEKHIVPGTAFKASATLLRIADLSTVWIEGQVYESELPWVKVGMKAEFVLEDAPDSPLTGKITFIEPTVENKTRTARVRVELPNPDGVLRPDRYARLNLRIDLGERLAVPEQAVIYAGKSRVVFVDLGDGRLLPKKIRTGLRNDDFIEVLDGLAAGDVIVTSGNFLIASESKLKAGLEQW
ncbi:efflux RND transporter periplasmic adaptor subunit [Methylobacter sp. BBA5.1]|jgi:membrane fusion protein, copper/silver efflux system|uniref:efflux RND transporter periplasmic adaptor subunit n=1 Tax=Methylobacter sp. BBA5.1 TaxID=1495064 RepID=UPI00056CFF17|nr:efflux RND transporter periplasmic adaptor subunit [Methylobacter sp. BBA5.1]